MRAFVPWVSIVMAWVVAGCDDAPSRPVTDVPSTAIDGGEDAPREADMEEPGDAALCARVTERDLACVSVWGALGASRSRAFTCPASRDARALNASCAATSYGSWSGYCCPASGDGGTPSGDACRGVPIETITRTGRRTVVRGDTTAAWVTQSGTTPPRVMQPIAAPEGCAAMVGQRVFAYQVGPAPAALSIETNNIGTATTFDTVLYVGSACDTALRDPRCGDSDARGRDAFSMLRFAYVNTDVLPAGTRVFIVLGGGVIRPTSGVTDHGAFELTISEVNLAADGEPCDAPSREIRCSEASACVLPTPGSPRGVCLRIGSVAGAPCRIDYPFCDSGMSCNQHLCYGTASPGGRCGFGTSCRSGESCVPDVEGSHLGTCHRDGSTTFAACRSGATGAIPCDAPLACFYSSTFGLHCGLVAETNGPCNARRDLCPSGQSCITAGDGGAIGTCRPAQFIQGASCGTEGACGGGLECVDRFCQQRATLGGSCDAGTLCPSGSACVFADPLRREGVCRTSGGPGGRCRLDAPRACDDGLRCDRFDRSGTCERPAAAVGARCELAATPCATGLRCVIAPDQSTIGTCQAESALPRAVASGGACDPIFGTTRCPEGEFCRASSERVGVCARATPEVEPDDAPDLRPSPAAGPSLYEGTLPAHDIDCYAVAVPEGGRVVASVSDGNGLCSLGNDLLFALDLIDRDGVTPRGASTGNGPFGIGRCAHIDGAIATHAWAGGLPAGTYHVCVRYDWNSTSARIDTRYVLSVATR